MRINQKVDKEKNTLMVYQMNIFLSTNSLRKQKEISLENWYLNIET